MKVVSILIFSVILWPVILVALWTGSPLVLVPPFGFLALAITWGQIARMLSRGKHTNFSRVNMDSAAEAGTRVVVFPHGSRSQSLIGRSPISPREIELAEEAADDYVFQYREYASKEPQTFKIQ